MSAALADQAAFTFGVPKALFPVTRRFLTGLNGYTASADGQRFLMNEHVGDCWADVLGNRAHGCESVKPTVSPGCVMMLAA